MTRLIFDEEQVKRQKISYLKLVRLHNKARKTAQKKERKKLKENSSKRFRRNPYEYGKKLLMEEEAREKEPEFDEASKFFEKEYKDDDRERDYVNPVGLKDLDKPNWICSTAPPTWDEFHLKLKSRRNKSAPGSNGVNYLIYKKCPSLSRHLHKLICRIWSTGVVPPQWKVGVSTLIPKTDDLKDPGKFRNITLQNCSGKLFFAIWGDRALEHMTRNLFIDTSVQKGFMKKTPGCLEHTQAKKPQKTSPRDLD